jgi:hypothetical protein
MSEHSTQESLYRCISCSNELLVEINLFKKPNTSSTCSSVYTKPQKLIFNKVLNSANIISDLFEGDIKCSQCRVVLGSYDWLRNSLFCISDAIKGLDEYLVIEFKSEKLVHKYMEKDLN